MIVQNLIYNRLGNSFSLMIELQNEMVQLHDEVHFSFKGKPVYISGISTLEKDKVIIGVMFNNIFFSIEFVEDDGLTAVYKDFSLKFISNWFEYNLDKDNFGEIMKVVNEKYDFISVIKDENGYKLRTKDSFLKGILEILSIKDLIRS